MNFGPLALMPGQRVLDLGCGPATSTIALGREVGAGGEVHGVDYDAAMISEADARARADHVAGWVRHHHANAAALPWPAGYFDAARSERVFQHLLEPERAFDEMLRVLKPGGAIAIVDADWATLSIDSDETELERRLVHFFVEQMVRNPNSGRHLYRMFKSRGVQELRIEASAVFLTDANTAREHLRLDRIAQEALAAGVVDGAELRRWHDSLARAADAGTFFASLNVVTLSGRLPARA